ncbi:translation initiation factor IF-2-like [Lutra lutra]|uniref:translation initiation factor IF-2-like n=1 Tax=Lutra lutra TaxID=9657 RepID=UPI001FD06193|nr:translation initiation factor IF-2-like [Lutra lutra]
MSPHTPPVKAIPSNVCPSSLVVPKLPVTELKGLVLHPKESEVPGRLYRHLGSRLHDLEHTFSVSPTTPKPRLGAGTQGSDPRSVSETLTQKQDEGVTVNVNGHGQEEDKSQSPTKTAPEGKSDSELYPSPWMGQRADSGARQALCSGSQASPEPPLALQAPGAGARAGAGARGAGPAAGLSAPAPSPPPQQPEAKNLLSSVPGGRRPGQPPPPPAPSAQEARPRGPGVLAGPRWRGGGASTQRRWRQRGTKTRPGPPLNAPHRLAPRSDSRRDLGRVRPPPQPPASLASLHPSRGRSPLGQPRLWARRSHVRPPRRAGPGPDGHADGGAGRGVAGGRAGQRSRGRPALSSARAGLATLRRAAAPPASTRPRSRPNPASARPWLAACSPRSLTYRERVWCGMSRRRRTLARKHPRKPPRRNPRARRRRLHSDPLPFLRPGLHPPRTPIGRRLLDSRGLPVQEVCFQSYWLKNPSITALKCASFRPRPRPQARAPAFPRDSRPAHPLPSRRARPLGSCSLLGYCGGGLPAF